MVYKIRDDVLVALKEEKERSTVYPRQNHIDQFVKVTRSSLVDLLFRIKYFKHMANKKLSIDIERYVPIVPEHVTSVCILKRGKEFANFEGNVLGCI